MRWPTAQQRSDAAAELFAGAFIATLFVFLIPTLIALGLRELFRFIRGERHG